MGLIVWKMLKIEAEIRSNLIWGMKLYLLLEMHTNRQMQKLMHLAAVYYFAKVN